MQVKKRIVVEAEDATFYFKPLTLEEAGLRKELADKIESGGNVSEMGDSLASLLLGWEGVKDEDDIEIVFDPNTYKDVFLRQLTVFQVVAVIRSYLKAIGWAEAADSLPNVSEGSSA